MNHGSLCLGKPRNRADEGERDAERSAPTQGKAEHANHQALCEFPAIAISYFDVMEDMAANRGAARLQPPYKSGLIRANLCQPSAVSNLRNCRHRLPSA